MRQLTLLQTLEFYDVPQIVTAADATGTRYLCTLYDQGTDCFRYLGVQISEPRLKAFIGGQLDLRTVYTAPEVENALYIVEAKEAQLAATSLLNPQDITEEMLPEKGYVFDGTDIVEDAESQTDMYQLEVPANDRMTFSTLIARMGWRVLSFGKDFHKIAVL